MNATIQTVILFLIFISRFVVLGVDHLSYARVFFLLLSFVLYTLLCFEVSESKQELKEIPQDLTARLLGEILAMLIAICILDLPALLIHKYLYFLKIDAIIVIILCITSFIINNRNLKY